MLSNFGSEKKSDSPLHFNFCFFKAHHCVFELHVTPFISGTLHFKDSWADLGCRSVFNPLLFLFKRFIFAIFLCFEFIGYFKHWY